MINNRREDQAEHEQITPGPTRLRFEATGKYAADTRDAAEQDQHHHGADPDQYTTAERKNQILRHSLIISQATNPFPGHAEVHHSAIRQIELLCHRANSVCFAGLLSG